MSDKTVLDELLDRLLISGDVYLDYIRQQVCNVYSLPYSALFGGTNMKEIDATKAEKVIIPNEICIEGTHIILRHEGHWEVSVTHPHAVYCSECLKEIAQAHREKYEDGILPNFCPNCGADMREKKE